MYIYTDIQMCVRELRLWHVFVLIKVLQQNLMKCWQASATAAATVSQLLQGPARTSVSGLARFRRQNQDMNMFPCSYNVSTAKLCLRKWGKRNETRTSKEVVDIYARGIRKNAFQLKQVCNNLNVCLAVGKRVHTELQITRSVLDN